MVPVSFANHEMLLVDGRALYWPQEQVLLVADLHLEKASWFAQFGAMLPPYDSRETLERVADAVRRTGARRVITLGDNFHDDDGANRLDSHAVGLLEALTRSLDWVWITGNHDENMHRAFGGELANELEIGGVVLRHIARPGETRAELSGHFHPRLRIRVRERHICRPCGVLSRSAQGADRMILPAFGTLTGGMDAGAPEVRAALRPANMIDAVLPGGGKLVQLPLWREAAQ